MIRTRSDDASLPASPEASLFKFLIYFRPDSEMYARRQGSPMAMYSFDQVRERAQFLPGLSQPARRFWSQFLQRIWRHPELHAFFRDCYPTWDDTGRLLIQFSPVRGPEMQALSARYAPTVREALAALGQPEFLMRPQPTGAPAPGFSPKRSPRAFDGLRRFEFGRCMRQWQAQGIVLDVQVFDNLCYHQDNHYGYLTPAGPPAPPAAPATAAVPPPVAVAAPVPPAPAPAIAVPAARDSRTSRPVVALGGLLTDALTHLQPVSPV